MRELASRRDSKNISPLLAGQLLRAIVGKLPYPRTLLTAAVERIRADRDVNSLRAAMLKAWLVRNAQKEVPMSLDIGITDVAYRLGRLFALVERIQENAVPGANATVRDRFFGGGFGGSDVGRGFGHAGPRFSHNIAQRPARAGKNSQGGAGKGH